MTELDSHALAEQMAPATGLRNRIVHEYERLDNAKGFVSAAEACRLFPEYVEAVERYIATA